MGSLVLYAVLALAVMGMIGTGVYKVKQWGGDEVRAELQPKLTACQADVKRQNDAVEALKAESARKQATAAQELRKAEGRAKTWDEQAKRLQAALTNRKPTDPQDCKAAWEVIRKP